MHRCQDSDRLSSSALMAWRSIRMPMGMLRKLPLVLTGHLFEVSLGGEVTCPRKWKRCE